MIIEIHKNKNDEWYGLFMGLFLLATSLFMMVELGPTGIVLGFFTFLSGLAFTIMFYRLFSAKKPFIELHEDFFLIRTAANANAKEFVDHIIKYNDIKSVSKVGRHRKSPDIIEMKISGENTDTNLSFGKNELTNENVRIDTTNLLIEKNKLFNIIDRKQRDPGQDLGLISSSIEYSPNKIPFHNRVIYLIFSSFITIYVGYGVFIGRLIIPSKKGSLVFYGTSLWIASIAFLFCVACVTIKIVDHYDKKDNESIYWRYSSFCFKSGVALYFIALIVNVLS
jgi:hypothetical protein